MPNGMHLRLTLASRILALQIVIVLAVVGVGAAASVFLARQQLDRQYEERSLTVADSVSSLPSVRAAVAAGDPDKTLQPLAESIRVATGATFIVITDDQGIRFTHPNPERIGERVSTDPEAALGGERWSGTEEGTLGVSVRGKVPIRDDGGRVIGIVSVGFLQEEVGSRLLAQLPALGAFLVISLLLGALGSLLLARRLKRDTFGLEPREIAKLLENREAILHGIREGTVAVDLDGRITLVNDEGSRLLGLDPADAGRPVTEVVPPGRVRDLLMGKLDRPDQLVLRDGRVLVANRMPVYVRGVVTGAVVTFRDRTELATATRELEGVRTVADALRAQAHEFSNRLHTIVGLVELGKPAEAISLSTEEAVVHQELIETLLGKVSEPTLSAILLSKAVVAAERGISLRLSDDTLLVRDIGDPADVVTIVGNLIDNALDAVASGPTTDGRWVDVAVWGEDASDGRDPAGRREPGASRAADAEGALRREKYDAVVVRVRDSGPGISPEDRARIFEEGFSTKEPGRTAMRGLGLALVQQIVRRRKGEVTVTNEGGAVFTVRLPLPPMVAPSAEAMPDQAAGHGPVEAPPTGSPRGRRRPARTPRTAS